MTPTVGLLGGGQLGRMLIESANRLNITVNVLDAANAPAKQISAHSGHVDGSFNDPECIKELAKRSDILTVEIEHVNTETLEEVSSQKPVEPSWKTLRLIQDKYTQHRHLTDHGIAVAEFEEIPQNTEAQVQKAAQKLGYPLMLKSRTQAYDGRGNFPITAPQDIPKALTALKDRPLYAEKWAPFTMELAVMVVKTRDATPLAFPCVETVHEDSICKLTYAPPRHPDPNGIAQRAQALAVSAVAAFPGKGVFGVEMFLLPDATLLVNEIAPRPHNSGHWTIEACGLSQYDAHLRAILDLPIPAASLRSSSAAIMLNILGGADASAHLRVADAAYSVPGAHIHLYGKGDARPGRKMGHVTVTAATLEAAERAVAPLIAVVDQVRAARRGGGGAAAPSQSTATSASEGVPPQPRARAPLVGVTMGSASDLATVRPGLAVLEELGVPFEVRITSAHRTPDSMAAYGREAAGRGLRVLIAAAGGAAHLPGMLAAYTALPVVGIPVKSASAGGEGMDALLSIVMMPRGVPVACVGTGNAVNAALLAVRILGASDEEVRARVEAYMRRAAAAAGESDVALRRDGWKA